MTNFEYFKERLVSIWKTGKHFGVSKETGKPRACENLLCNECAFDGTNSYCCSEDRAKWLDEEYVEPRNTVSADVLKMVPAIKRAMTECRVEENCDDCPYFNEAVQFPYCRMLYIIEHLAEEELIRINRVSEQED